MVEQRTHNPLVAGSNPAGPTTKDFKLINPGGTMKELQDKILKYGKLEDGTILKVDSFLNHQVDTQLVNKMADEWVSKIKSKNVNKILTIESSGIALAYPVAHKLQVPLVIARKHEHVNIYGDYYSAKIISYTHFREYDVVVSKKFLNKTDRIYVVDDFLANGCALKGLLSIIKQSGAYVVGIGIAIEKAMQPGGTEIRNAGFVIDSLARIKEFDKQLNKPVFIDE